MRSTLAVMVALACSDPAVAQTGPMPTDTVVPDAFLESLNGERIRMLYDGIGQPFLFELQDRDVSNLFSYGFPPPDTGLTNSDIVVVLRNDWTEARAFYEEALLDPVAQALPVPGVDDANAFVNVSVLNVDDRDVRIYTFVRKVGDDLQDQRCMARLVIDDTYRGAENGNFDSALCSSQIE